MALLSAFCLAYTAFTALCLSMQRHHRDLFGAAPSVRRALLLKVAGWVLLAASLVPALSRGMSIGIVIWFGLISAAVLLLVWTFAYRPRLAVVLALIALILSSALLLSVPFLHGPVFEFHNADR